MLTPRETRCGHGTSKPKDLRIYRLEARMTMRASMFAQRGHVIAVILTGVTASIARHRSRPRCNGRDDTTSRGHVRI